MSTQLDRFIESLGDRVVILPRGKGDGEARCPAHEDDRPSLTFRDGDEGVVVKCHAGAGCSTESITGAIGLRVADLFAPRARSGRADGDVVYPYRDEGGALLFQVVRKPGKKFLQRHPCEGSSCAAHPEKRVSGGWCWSTAGLRRVLFRLPEVLAAAAAGRRVYVTEGEKDALALVSIGLDATTNPGGAGKWRREYGEALRGAGEVVVWPDKDEAGLDHAAKVAAAIARVVQVVKVLDVPGEGKQDAADWIAAGGTRAQLEELVGAAPADLDVKPANRSAPASGRPKIVATSQVKDVVDQAELALLGAQRGGRVEVYQRGGELVRVVEGDTVPRLEGLPLASLLELLSHVAAWSRMKPGRDGACAEVDCKPPREVVEALSERRRWLLPMIDVVVDVPVMRPDGTIHASPGPDPATRTLFRPRLTFPAIPERPSRDDAIAALAELAEPYCDFLFQADSDRSAALALVLTLVARRAIAGPTPLFVIGGTTPGLGKSLVVDLAHAIATGERRTPRMVQSEKGNAGEEAKRMLAMCLDGVSLALIDNVDRPLGSAVLDAVLTGDRFRDRLLGKSRVVDAPIPVLAASGNNLSVRGDLVRRVVACDLATDLERPEERDGFRFPNVLSHVLAERPRLVAAALTVLRAYFVAGRPDVGLAPFGSFEAWSNLVRSSLVWLDQADPLVGQARLRAAGDPRVEAATGALAAWHDAFRDAPVEVATVIAHAGKQPEGRVLRAALAALSKKLDPERLDARVVADELRSFTGRVLGGRRLERVEDRRTKLGALFRVVLVGKPAIVAHQGGAAWDEEDDHGDVA